MPTLLDEPSFLEYDAKLNASWFRIKKRLVVRGFFSHFANRVRNYNPSLNSYLYSNFLDVWGGDRSSLNEGRAFLRKYAFKKSDSPGYRAILAAYKKVIVLGEDPVSDLEVQIAILRLTRGDRWWRLSNRLNISFPGHFDLWRGVRCIRYDFIRDVVDAWRFDDERPIPFTHNELTSWSLRSEAAEKFVKNSGRRAGIIVNARIPFADTLADKWVDDAAYIVPWALQDEVLVATRYPDSIMVNSLNTIVWYNNRRYTYANRRALISAWEENN